MTRERPAVSWIRRFLQRAEPASDGLLRWLPVGGGLAIVIALALAYWLSGDRAPERIAISSGTAGGTYHALGEVIAQALARADPPLRADVIKSSGAVENARRVALRPNVLGLVQSNTQLGRDVKLIARLYPEVFHLLVRADAGVESVADLAGKRVALMPEGSGSNASFYQLLDHYQVPRKAVSPAPGTLKEGLQALADGGAQALFVVIALGNESIAQAIRDGGIQLLGIDQAQAIALFDPAISRMMVPKGVYSGNRPVPREEIEVMSVDALLVANAGLPDDVAGAIVATLFERRQQMVEGNRQAAFISEPTAQQRLTIGIHPGAESYYERDKPSFLVEYAEPIGVAISVVVLLASGLWQARTWLSNARKNRADRYNLQIAQSVEEMDKAATLDELERIRARLSAIFQEVVADLDNDRIEESSLQSFSFVWEVAQSTLSQRQLMLAGGARQHGEAKPKRAPRKSSAAKTS